VLKSVVILVKNLSLNTGMYMTMFVRKPYFILLTCLLLTGLQQEAGANHIFGGELFYTHVSGNTYKITMVLYGDCGNSSGAFDNLPNNQPQVNVYNGASFITTLHLSIQPGSGTEVSPVCPDEMSQTKCVNPNNALPGVKRFIYAANYTLSGPSANWRFRSNGELGSSNQAGRSSAITNVVGPGSSIMALEATLNNTTAANSSPVYTTIPTPFFCINKPQEYNPGAVDPNTGDSLAFALVPGMGVATGSTVTYVAPATATEPLLCQAGSYSFNSANGQLSFYPNQLQNALVVGKVSEYRNGILVGTSMREMTFVVLNNCLNNPPDGTITNPVNGTIVNGTTIKACASPHTLSFSIGVSDPDGDNVTLSVQGAPSGASVTVGGNGTPAPVVAFSWNLGSVAPGNYIFYLDFTDDGCPLVSKQTIAYTIQVLPSPGMSYALVQQPTCTAKGIFTITPAGNDYPYTFQALQGATAALTRNNITGMITDSLAAGTYTFRITNNSGCSRDTAVTLTELNQIFPQISWTQPFCPGGNTGTIAVTATGANPPFLYSVGTLPYAGNGTFSGFTAGTYVVHVQDAAGCIRDSAVTITNPVGMTLGLGIRKPVCSPVSNGQITVTATNGTAPYQYALNTGSYSSSNTFTGLGAGSYTIHVKDAHDCLKDTMITLADSLHMQLQAVVAPVSCYGGSNGSVTLVPSGTTAPYMYALGTGAFGSTATFNNLSAGTYVFHVSDQNQCLKDTTVSIAQPTALDFALDIAHVSCHGTHGGSVTVNAQGGVPAYQYAAGSGPFQSSNQLTGLAAGMHTIHLKDNNGCTKDTTVTLTEPATAVAFGNLTIVTPTCEGFADGSVTLSGAGGTGPYTFALGTGSFAASPVFAQLTEGSYTFRVKDHNGCTKDTLITLTGFPHIFIDEVSMTEPTCNGKQDGTITVTASGGLPPFRYQLGSSAWSANPVFSQRPAGTYILKVQDANQCIKDTTVILGQPDALVVDTSSVGNDCNGIDDGGMIEVTVSGGTAPFTYAWQHAPGHNSPRVTGLVNGIYTVSVTDANGCTGAAEVHILYNNCCTPFIPNAFTPNGDGRNDIYRVEYKGDMDLKEMYIYNRYGQRVFSSANVSKSWDGTFNGQAVDGGTYYYYIRILCGNVRKKELVFKGDLTLVR